MNYHYVYVQYSPAHKEGLLKIGSSTDSAEARRKALSGSTETPLPFVVLAELRVPAVRGKNYPTLAEDVEKTAHHILKTKRINKSREFFEVSLEQALEAIDLAMLQTGAREKMQKDLDREEAERRAIEVEAQRRAEEKRRAIEVEAQRRAEEKTSFTNSLYLFAGSAVGVVVSIVISSTLINLVFN